MKFPTMKANTITLIEIAATMTALPLLRTGFSVAGAVVLGFLVVYTHFDVDTIVVEMFEVVVFLLKGVVATVEDVVFKVVPAVVFKTFGAVAFATSDVVVTYSVVVMRVTTVDVIFV